MHPNTPPPPGGSPPPPGRQPPPVPAYPSQPYRQPGYPPAGPVAAMPVTPAAGPIGGTPRQWEARARRMVKQGRTRDQILYELGQANWPLDQAQTLVSRLASKERWVAVWIIVGMAVMALAGFGILLAELASRHGDVHGGEFAFIVTGVGGVIYGLVRLVAVKV
ncbi:MAG TPA: hypothetical protein VF796_02300 [Humisphaera sp.]